MNTLALILLQSIAVFVAAFLVPGVHVASFSSAIAAAVVLGLINHFLRPALFVLTLPINILTLGLFSFVIIGLCTLLVSAVVPGFVVDSFLWALVFAGVLGIIRSLLRRIAV